MAIEFHCSHCGKLVRTANEHGGKRGKCPGCHQSVYIPTAEEEIEPLRLAPRDERDAQRQQELMAESRRLAETLRGEREEIKEIHREVLPEPEGDVRLPSDMETLVIEYVLAMADGNLSEAEEYASQIHQDRARADDVIQRITMDELPPPALQNVPRPVMQGFLRQLRAE